MKKIVISVTLAALFIPNSHASNTVTPQDSFVVSEPTPEVTCTSNFSGINFLLGIGGSFLNSEFKNNEKRNYTNFNSNSRHLSRLIGTIGIGGGREIAHKYYIGSELLFDFTNSKKRNNFVPGASSSRMQNNGTFLSLGIRTGYIISGHTICYFKIAASHSKAKAYIHGAKDISVKANKIVPSLTLGAEKAFCKKYTARLEGEYRFKSSKKADGFQLKANDGFNIRALVSYNVHY